MARHVRDVRGEVFGYANSVFFAEAERTQEIAQKMVERWIAVKR